MSIFTMPIKSQHVETFFGLKSGQLSSFECFDDVSSDSRNVPLKHLFFALPGVSSNGWDYLENIATQGCRAVVVPASISLDASLDLVYIRVEDSLASLTQYIAHFGGDYPEHVCAVTGTNGKSSISFYNAQIANYMGKKAAIVGTFGVGVLGALEVSDQTTPDVLSMHSLAIGFARKDVSHLTFEASSHALDQRRIEGLPIDTAIYSNLSRDHLDYHGSMAEYAKAKSKLFAFSSLKRAVICLDDEFSGLMLKTAVSPVYTYSLKHDVADFYCENLTYLASGVTFDLTAMNQKYQIKLPLLGEFNVANAIAALAANWDEFEDKNYLVSALTFLEGAPGRMQMVCHKKAPLVVVDYAHTPAAIEVALQALRLHNRGKLICIYGCGGDRDRGKRPLMTQAALSYSDKACLTSDNPRTEAVQQILDDALAQLNDQNEMISQDRLKVVADRKEAIIDVISHADRNDVILIAGKGHENYQDIDGVKHHFDDAEIALEGLKKCWSN